MSLFQRIKKFIQVYRLPYDVRPPYTHIVQAGDPVLRKPSDYVQRADIKSAEIQDVIFHKIVHTCILVLLLIHLKNVSSFIVHSIHEESYRRLQIRWAFRLSGRCSFTYIRPSSSAVSNTRTLHAGRNQS